jgi:pimeloyl-ACP methyl ester carboxylesterase
MMGFVSSNEVQIHYEVEGSGPPLLLVHGRGWSMKDWYRHGFPEALKDEFQVILMDTRGFGESDKPHDEKQYGQLQFMEDACAVLDAVGVERTHYWGYSMGGKLGWALAVNRPERLRSVVIGEYPALGDSTSDEDRYRWEAQAKLLRVGIDIYVAGMEMGQGRLPEYQRERTLGLDPLALAAQQLGNFYWGATEDQVRAITLPMFIYTGADRVEGAFSNVARTRDSAAMVAGATYHQFDIQGHEPTFAACEVVTPVVRQFLRGVEAIG